MPHRLRDLLITKVSLVPRGANPDAHVVLFKSQGDASSPESPQPIRKEESVSNVKKTIAEMTLEELQAYATELEKSQPAPDPEPPAIPADVQKQLDEQSEALRKANERNEAAERVVKELQDARACDQFTTQVEKSFPTLPGDPMTKGAALFAVKKAVTPELYAAVEAMLKAGEEAMAKATVDIGDDQPDDSTTPTGQLRAIAQKMADEGKAPTYAQAMVKAIETNPSLYAKARNASRRVIIDEDE
jgi:hypothetical protein